MNLVQTDCLLSMPFVTYLAWYESYCFEVVDFLGSYLNEQQDVCTAQYLTGKKVKCTNTIVDTGCTKPMQGLPLCAVL
jgi:hypothetical protein